MPPAAAPGQTRTSRRPARTGRGTGQVRVQQRTPFGVIQTSKTCPKCGGTGKVIKDPCPDCKGQGRIRRTKKLEVSVPAGIDDGQTFVLRGQGDQGINGGRPAM